MTFALCISRVFVPAITVAMTVTPIILVMTILNDIA